MVGGGCYDELVMMMMGPWVAGALMRVGRDPDGGASVVRALNHEWSRRKCYA